MLIAVTEAVFQADARKVGVAEVGRGKVSVVKVGVTQ